MEGVSIFAKNALIGGLFIVGASIFNRRYGGTNISKLLQLVVNIV